MIFVLETVNGFGEVKYIFSKQASVYNPQYAARYDSLKAAQTVAARLKNDGCFDKITVRELDGELIEHAKRRNEPNSDIISNIDYY